MKTACITRLLVRNSEVYRDRELELPARTQVVRKGRSLKHLSSNNFYLASSFRPRFEFWKNIKNDTLPIKKLITCCRTCGTPDSTIGAYDLNSERPLAITITQLLYWYFCELPSRVLGSVSDWSSIYDVVLIILTGSQA